METQSLVSSWRFPIIYRTLHERYVRWWMALLAALTATIAITATVERVWTLRGIGLSQHFGFLAMFATAPFLVLLANSLLEDVASILYATGDLVIPGDSVDASIERARRAFGFWFDWLLLTLLTVGGVALLRRNAIVTRAAERYFGQDVLDSARHSLTFYTAKAYLGVMWLVLYPAVVLLSVRAILAMAAVVRGAIKSRQLNVDFFGPDDCGNMTRLGRVYYKVLSVTMLFSLCSLASFMTHKVYRPQITLLAVGSFAVGIASYFAALRPLHLYAAAERRVPLSRLAADLRSSYAKGEWSRCTELIAIRSAVLSSNTYALPASEAVVVLLITAAQLIIAAWVVVAAPPLSS